MKPIIPFCCLLALWACNEGAKNNTVTDSVPLKPDTAVAPALRQDTAKALYISDLRKGDTLIPKKVYADTLTFIKYNDDGDDALFVCVKNKDTMALIFNAADAPALNNGDLVALQWKLDLYAPAGDPEFSYPSEYVVDYRLLQPGKVTRLKKNYALLKCSYSDKEVSDWGKTAIEEAVWYYIANTTDTVIRKTIDVEHAPLEYRIEQNNNGGNSSVNNIIFATTNQPVLKRMFFNVETPYSLSE
ncbi:hypothetical protein ACTJJ0_28335 [Chitinophaga sp. 22321]|uniref:Uncharacterized protein n=1 Tax=Chitinophaga hostae TaxID=2831022 RepID=A0ABS5J9A6_9BACT|nr:hypothetical protein [Chitinophaga hostae]MBS0031633.1 hypothetical protein [Chitinophaga hostae]